MDLIFGRRMLVHWLLDPQIVYLNHGTVGATPIPVIEHWRRIQDEIERQPAQYLLRELADHAAIGEPAAPRMRVAARSIARSVGCDADQFVFVDNATAGCNAVLRSFPLERGEDIAITSLGYGGVNHAADFIARERGATVRTIELPLPGAAPDEYVAAIEAGLSPRTRLLMVDHITSQTALVLPLAEIAAVCRRRGIAVLADGAHAPGAIELDIESLGVDFYVANLHKSTLARTPLWFRMGCQIARHSASAYRAVLGLSQRARRRVRPARHARPLELSRCPSCRRSLAKMGR